MIHLKTVKVTNHKNVLVQMPGFVVQNYWRLQDGDSVEVLINDENNEIIIRPRRKPMVALRAKEA